MTAMLRQDDVKQVHHNAASNDIEDHTLGVLRKAKDLIYRCQFNAAIKLIQNTGKDAVTEVDYVDLQLLLSTCLYEVQATEEAHEQLRQLSATHKFQCRAAFHYAMGKLSYFEANYDSAIMYFETIDKLTENTTLKFRGLLGVANVYYSTGVFAMIPHTLARLEQLKDQVSEEDQISHLILLGNFYRSSGPDKILASKYFQRALEVSATKAWTYFIQRSIYGLACIAQAEQRTPELKLLLKVLKGLSDQTESALFRRLLIEKFRHLADNSGIEIDIIRMRVKRHDVTIDLSDRPLIFQFIRSLEHQIDFVSKAKIAAILWPDEKYLSHTHDARIFDIAKRVRKVMQRHFGDSMTIISNRLGYRLVKANS